MYVVVLFHALGDNENTKKFTSPVQMQVFPPNMFDPLLVGVMDMGPQDTGYWLTGWNLPQSGWYANIHSLRIHVAVTGKNSWTGPGFVFLWQDDVSLRGWQKPSEGCRSESFSTTGLCPCTVKKIWKKKWKTDAFMSLRPHQGTLSEVERTPLVSKGVVESTRCITPAFKCPGLCAGKDGKNTLLLEWALGQILKWRNGFLMSCSCQAYFLFSCPAPFLTLFLLFSTLRPDPKSLESCQVNAVLTIWSQKKPSRGKARQNRILVLKLINLKKYKVPCQGFFIY